MNVDNRVRPFLQKAFGSLPAPPIRAGIMRQMGGFVENHVDPLLLQGVSEIARHIVYAALPVDALRSVGGHIAFVAVGDVHCNQLAGIVGLCVGSGHGDFRRKDGLRSPTSSHETSGMASSPIFSAMALPFCTVAMR